MPEQIPTQAGGRANGGFCREKLGGKAADKAQHRHQQHQRKIDPYDTGVPCGNALVNNPGNQERHCQVKGCFQHFKGRCQNTLQLILFHIGA